MVAEDARTAGEVPNAIEYCELLLRCSAPLSTVGVVMMKTELVVAGLGTPTLCRRHPSVKTSMLHHKDKARESIQRHWLALYRNIIRIRGCVVTSVFNNLLSLGQFDLA